MQILVNTDNNIRGTAELHARVSAVVEDSLGRFGDRITRVEVQLTDENSSQKTGDNDMRCALEARVAGHQPIAVTHLAPTLEEAVDGACDKLQRTLDRTLGRIRDPKGRTSFGGDQTI